MENSLLNAERVASPIFDLVAGNSLLSAENVASPILDLKWGSSSLWSGYRNYLLSCDKVASPINFNSSFVSVAALIIFFGGRISAKIGWLLLLTDAITTACSSAAVGSCFLDRCRLCSPSIYLTFRFFRLRGGLSLADLDQSSFGTSLLVISSFKSTF